MANWWTLRISAGALKTLAFAAALMLAVGAGLAFAFPKHAELLSQIQIQASPEQVWAVLTDTSAYPAWNPEISSLTGSLTPGSVIENHMGKGNSGGVFHPVVLVAAAPRELRWQGHLVVPAFFSAEHYFLLERKGNGTLFTQGESLSGAALWLFDAARILPGFYAMNAALKRRVEAEAKQSTPPE